VAEQSKSINLGFYPKLVIVILLAVAASEAAPEVVNTVLVLILIGLLLSHWGQFAGLTKILGTLK